jgi:glycosyltransferase involved in cell wall biosynthesis
MELPVASGLVSVVIPTFNRAYCLPVAIGSLQSQTYPDWEALVIDDGSSDNTADVVRALAANDGRVKYVFQPNQGVSAARNTGIGAASGAWVGFLDSDDSWEPWKLSAQIACFRQLPQVGMVWTDMNAFDADGKLVSARHLRKMYSAYARAGHRKIFEGTRRFEEFEADFARGYDALAGAEVSWGDIHSSMFFGNLIHTSTVLLTRERVQAVAAFDRRFRTGEDYDFHLRTCREGPVALLDAPSIRYRIAGGADQLTSPAHKLELAINALRTREAALERDRGRIDLSDAELKQVMARAHRDVAEELFEVGDPGRARAYFMRSGLLASRDSRLLAKAILCLFPSALAKRLLGMIRSMR